MINPIQKNEMYATPESLKALEDWIKIHSPEERIHLYTAVGMANNLLYKIVQNEILADFTASGEITDDLGSYIEEDEYPEQDFHEVPGTVYYLNGAKGVIIDDEENTWTVPYYNENYDYEEQSFNTWEEARDFLYKYMTKGVY